MSPTVIIIAAGIGSRLEHMTEDLPKCLIEINGKSILERQLEIYRALDLNDIYVIKGYKKEHFDSIELKYFINDDYENNNILVSLMYAEKAMVNGFLASYSDIVFNQSVVESLLDCSEDISIVVDTDWLKSYEGRTDHPIDQAESVNFDDDNVVLEIGKHIGNEGSTAKGEFIGMLKCTKSGAEVFREYYHNAKKEFAGKPFEKANVFENAYITDLLQYITNAGIDVHCTSINGSWKEIDTIQDFKNAESCF